MAREADRGILDDHFCTYLLSDGVEIHLLIMKSHFAVVCVLTSAEKGQ